MSVPYYVALWDDANKHWQVVAPIGVVVERWPTRQQALDACGRYNAAAGLGVGIEADEQKETDE